MVISRPTVYAGCTFRSRLEANWAAFFDLMGWKWSYEPMDFNGWVPDFVLIGKKQRIFVEVKPYFSQEEFVSNEVIEKVTRAMNVDDQNEILLLGVDVDLEKSYFEDAVVLGWLIDFTMDTGRAILLTTGGFCHDSNSYHDRISGFYDGGHVSEMPKDEAIEKFNEAKSIVQWSGNNWRRDFLK